MRESQFQSQLIGELKKRFPGCIVMKNDSGHNQGIPDLTVLYGGYYALLECKRDAHAPAQPNQEWYVDRVNEMGGFARFIFPENKEAVLYELEQSFEPRRQTLVP